MEKIKSSSIIKKNSLISRKFSKLILKNIREDREFEKSLNNYISETLFTYIKKKYKEKLLYLKENNVQIIPRNLPFLYLIKDIDNDFEWTINNPSTISNENTDLVVKSSNVEGLTPSFSSIIFNLVDKNLHKNKIYPEFLEKDENIKLLTLELFEQVQFATGLLNINISLVECFQKAIKNQSLNILTPLCPDYANINLGKGFYTLTFDGLGSSVGVTAKRLLENLDIIHSVFNRRNIKVSHTAAIGDFEALSEDTCQRVKLSRNEFIEKLILSQQKLKKHASDKLNTILFTDLCNGFKNWSVIHNKFYKMLINNDFGNANLTLDKIKIICESRKPLLYRWFGKISDKQILEVVLWQGAEYAAMGYIAKENMDNPLVIGADHFKMAPFYSVGSDLPILYLTSNYIRN